MRLALLALVVAAPAFAFPPAAKVASACPKGAHARKVTECSAMRRVTAELQACGKFDFVDIYIPGPADKPELRMSEKIALQPEAKTAKPRMGAPKLYKGKGVELAINWTTSPDPKTGGHHGTLSFGATKNVDVTCKMVK